MSRASSKERAFVREEEEDNGGDAKRCYLKDAAFRDVAEGGTSLATTLIRHLQTPSPWRDRLAEIVGDAAVAREYTDIHTKPFRTVSSKDGNFAYVSEGEMETS